MTSSETTKRLDGFIRECRKQGLRITPQRLEIFSVLALTNEHPNIESIFNQVRKRIPVISLDTVYKTVNLLVNRGIVSRINCDHRFSRYDAQTDQHHHFFCSECKTIKDLDVKDFNGINIPTEIPGIGTVQSLGIEISGKCVSCR